MRCPGGPVRADGVCAVFVFSNAITMASSVRVVLHVSNLSYRVLRCLLPSRTSKAWTGGMVHACVAMSCLAETTIATLRVGHATPIAAFQPSIQVKRSTRMCIRILFPCCTSRAWRPPGAARRVPPTDAERKEVGRVFVLEHFPLLRPEPQAEWNPDRSGACADSRRARDLE